MATEHRRRLAVYLRESVRDTRRERQAHVVVGLYVLVAGAVSYGVGRTSEAAGGSTGVELASQIVPLLGLLTPLVAVGLASSSIAERRRLGSLKVELGLPISRSTVVVGTFLSRSVLIGGAIVAGMATATVVGLGTGVTVSPVLVVGGTTLLVLLGVVFTAFGVLASVVIRSPVGAMAAAFGIWISFALQLWEYLPMAVLYVRHGFSVPDSIPTWVHFVSSLNPLTAHSNLVGGALPELGGGIGAPPVSNPAVYERPSFAFLVCCLWTVLVIGVAVRQFERSDL